MGVAYACNLKGLNNRVYAIVGDGELNEGLVWESFMFASHQKLNNLTVIIDHNHLQADGTIEEVLNTAPLKEKLVAFGFDTCEVDGHSVESIHQVLGAPSESQPSAIIAETLKGKGVSFMENQAGSHGKAPNDEQYAIAMDELEKAGEALCQK